MKFRSAIVFAALLQLLSCPLVQANISFVSNESGQRAHLSGEARTKSVGALKGNGLVNVNQDRISVLFQSADLTSKTPALIGTTFKTHNDEKKRVVGFAFFDGGAQIQKLEQPTISETITTIDGNTLTGRMIEIIGGRLSLQTARGLETVDLAQIKSIQSPRVFEFETSTDGGTIAFTNQQVATVNAQPISQTSVVRETQIAGTPNPTVSASCHKGKRIIVSLIALCLIATAIAVPVAVGVATHHHHHHVATPIAFSPAAVPQPVTVTRASISSMLP